jgi:predicted membrane GTPase involved in stress response
MSLQPAIDYIGSDELVEATPNSLRLRKRIYAVTYGKWVEPVRQTPTLETVS